jgi:ribosomal protein S6--L-glutamate ligase
MKKIAYFYRIDKWGTTERFVSEAATMGVEIVPIRYKELMMEQKKNSVVVSFKGSDLKDFDIFYFRAVGSELEWSKVLTKYADMNGIPVADEYLKTDSALRRYKSVGGMFMCLSGVRYPVTVYADRFEDMRSVVEKSALPVIVKMSSGGRHGMSTFWVRTNADLDEVKKIAVDVEGKQKRGYLVQEYIENDGDYRVFCVGYKVVGGFKRAPKEEKLVMNKSVGKSTSIDELPAEIIREAELSARATGVEVAGIDLVMNKHTGEVVVIEVNEAPQFKVFEKRTGMNAVKEILNYLVQKAR